jgi:hypothetical protein
VAAAGTACSAAGTVSRSMRVVSTASTLFFVQREDDQSFVYLLFNNSTRFEDASARYHLVEHSAQ